MIRIRGATGARPTRREAVTSPALRHPPARVGAAALALTLGVALGLGGCEDSDASADASAGIDSASDGLSADVKLVLCSAATDCPPAQTPCTAPSCSASGHCVEVPAPDGAACTSDDPCVSGPVCQSGSCVGTYVCECKVDADCASAEDGDLCNGTLYCDTAARKPTCKVLASSVKTCDTSTDTTCRKTACVAATGQCVQQAVADRTACDDNEACTGPDACAAGQCFGPSSCQCQKPADCDAFDDGNPCNGTLTCDTASHTCVVVAASVVQCGKGKAGACSAPACDPATGTCKESNLADGDGCDLDGSICSEDTCKGGQCTPGALATPCVCASDADCAPFDDGNACNGSLFCSKPSGFCELNPATVVTCATLDDTACAKNTCQPATGQCQYGPVADGTLCDDGWDCSTDESCKAGQCVAAKNTCECKASADCKAFEAQNQCAKFYCDKPKGVCTANPATVKTCSSPEYPACALSVCDPKTGGCVAKPINEGGPCEADGSWCTNLDVCAGGTCKAASNKCPCLKDGDCAAFDDGNPCNGELYCDKPTGACVINKATLPNCSGAGDGPCKPIQCDPSDGACKPLPLPDEVTCDSDDFVCTVERCKAGSCALVGQACLCYEPGDCDAFEDGDACNGTLYCEADGAPPYCKKNPASAVSCPAPLAGECTASVCDPSDGVCKTAPGADGGACVDDDICSEKDSCVGGVCVGVPIDAKVDCNDGNGCTVDSCSKGVGCVHIGDVDAGCDDSDACTQDDACDLAGACTGVAIDAAALCDDGNVCTDDGCDKLKGCVAVANSAPCDDGDACSSGDACLTGVCKAKGSVACDDGNVCTVDSCDAQVGCVTAAADADVGCDDGDACTNGDTCDGKGGCAAGTKVACDDGNACTDDACDVAKGCTSAPNAAACDDGNACTDKDGCADGSCQPGALVACDDGNVCTTDSCDVKQGCASAANTASCDDGDACTGNDACAGGSCSGSPTSCDDGNPCTQDSCDVATGCLHAPGSAPCNDGNACTDSDACDKGACVGGPSVDCDDGEVCTADSCTPATGCAHAPVAKGTPCSALDFCGEQRACVAGTCEAPDTTAMKSILLSTSPAASLHDGAMVSASLVAFAGVDVKGSAANVLWRNPTSPTATSATYPWPASTTAVGDRIAARAAGGLLYLGLTAWKSSAPTPYLYAIASDGKLKSSVAIDTSGSPIRLDDFRFTGASTLSYAGVGNGGAYYCRTDLNGAYRGCAAMLKGSKGYADVRLTELESDAFAIAGTATALKASTRGFVAVVDDDGFPAGLSVRWGVHLDDILGNDIGADVGRHPDGSVLVFGAVKLATGGHKPWIMKLAAKDGAALKSYPLGTLGNAVPSRVVALADKTFLVAGQRLLSGQSRAFLARLGPDGSQSIFNDLFLPQKNVALGAVAMADAIYAFGAVQESEGAASVPFVAQLDALSVPDCASPKACANKKLDDCDDNNVCTIDSCDPNKGCVSAPTFDGAACSDGNACTESDGCKAGACAPGPALDCDDGTLCTIDGCDPQLGCTTTAVDAGVPCVAGICSGTGSCLEQPGAPELTQNDTTGLMVYDDNGKRDVRAFGLNTKGLLPGAQGLGPHGIGPIPGSGDARLIALGDAIACLVTIKGEVRCWGTFGGANHKIDNKLDIPDPVTWIDAYDDTVCMVTAKGEVWCMDEKDAKPTKTLSKGGDGVYTMVFVGGEHVCAYDFGGKVHCYGRGDWGELGDGNQPPSNQKVTPDKAVTVVRTDGQTLGVVTDGCAGSRFSCARTADNEVWCWGHGLYGQIGSGSLGLAIKAAKVAGTGNTSFDFKARTVDCGAAFACSQSASGVVVKCWGQGTSGQIGDGALVDRKFATSVNAAGSGQINAKGKTLGLGTHTGCLASGLDLTCWGSNENNIFGLYASGQSTDPHVPQAVLDADNKQPIAGVSGIFGGGGLFNAKQVGGGMTWGNNEGGGATPSDSNGVFDLAVSNPAITAGFDGTMTRDMGCRPLGVELECWGANQFGYVVGKLTSPSQITTPVKVSNIASFTAFATSVSHGCAVIAGEVHCWGRDQSGELGRGTNGGAKAAAAVTGPKGIKQLSLYERRSCVLDSNGAVWCWGNNPSGEAGTPNDGSGLRTTPHKVVASDAYSKVATGKAHTCAVRVSDGKVECWGYNGKSANILGIRDASVLATDKPSAVLGLSGQVVELAAGNASTCAILQGGAVQCWGANYYAQLGSGSAATVNLNDQPVTVQVPKATALVAGAYAYCARLGNGQVWCWGSRTNGQVGRGVGFLPQATAIYP